jgi:branched-chain amino acid transport system permease protein
MEITGFAAYAIFFVTFVGIYGVLTLGLNMQWGLSGQFNIGIAAFFAVGAYVQAVLTTSASPVYLGGFGLPFAAGLPVAMILAGVLAFLIGLITLKLRADYLAIATIGIAEIVRLFLKNEAWLTHGVRGIPGIEKPFTGAIAGAEPLIYMLIVLFCVLLVFVVAERARRAPWGRVLRAIRENEDTARAAGKHIVRFRLQAFVIGSMIMGLAGALYAPFFTFISPEAFDPLFATFLVWVMLIVGGSGNNAGALVGALVIWVVWSGTEVFTSRLPVDMATQAGALRLLLIGALLQVILLFRSQGLLPERWRSGRKPPPEPQDEDPEPK